MLSDFERTGRLHRKIDIFMRDHCGAWQYQCSTNWWRTCRDARAHWQKMHLGDWERNSRGRLHVKARFAK